MGHSLKPAATPPPAAQSSLLLLTPPTLSSDESSGDSSSPGMRLTADAEICVALRTAMHLHGSRDTPLPSAERSWLADRYIHQRIVVNEHTAAAVLLDCLITSSVQILHDFPAVAPPAYITVAQLLHQPPDHKDVCYTFMSRRSRVHYIFTQPWGDSLQAQAVKRWWSKVNQLPELGHNQALSSDAVFNFVSRRGKSVLHVDEADGVTTQIVGKKLWVLVKEEEALRHGIVVLTGDAMREENAGVHRLISWKQCLSFQWCILQEGDTIVLPRDRLHAVCCIGEVDSISTGLYCWLRGTANPNSHSPASKQRRKRKRSPSPTPTASVYTLQPLPLVQHAIDQAGSTHLPPLARAAAAILHADGQPLSVASAKAGTSRSTAQRWHKRLKTTGDLSDAPRSGRPHATTAEQDAAIVNASDNQPFLLAREIRNDLSLPVSASTVGRRLDEAGLPSRVAARKRHYTDDERRKRLSFAHGYSRWTAEDWERVIFADEVTVEGDGRQRHIRVRRPDGHRFDSKYTVHSRIYTPSHHFFACFCSRGPGYCAGYEGKLDGSALKRLLDRTVIATAELYYQTDPLMRDLEQWWFLHDNSPAFTSRTVKQWLHNHGVQLLEWPSNSPDLNPIENLWPRVHQLMDRVQAKTDDAVGDAFIEAWESLDLDLFTSLAQSMPDRIQAVIDAKGDATSF